MSQNSNIIFLIGFMGTGKTTIGKILSDKIKYQLYDTDILIEENQGKKISEIFTEVGEVAFREMEKETLLSLINKENIIISTGGGLPTYKDNLKIMLEHGKVISLVATPECILERIEKDGNTRPILDCDNKLLKIISLMEKRAYSYIMSHVMIDTTNKTKDEVLSEILERIEK